MAVITLTANKFIGTLTNLIAYSSVLDTLERGAIYPLIDSCRANDVTYGNGKVVLTTDLPEVEDTNFETSSLLTRKVPKVWEQYIPVENFKTIQLTINRWLLRGAFVEENAMSNLIGYLLFTMQKAKDVFLYQQILKQFTDMQYSAYSLANYFENDAVYSKIDLIDTSAMTDPSQIRDAEIINGERIYYYILNKVSELAFPRKIGTGAEQATYITDPSSLIVIMPYGINTAISTQTMANIFNGGELKNSIRWGKTVLVDNLKLANAGENTDKDAIIICHKDKVQYGYFYNVATSFFDASTLNENHWLHFSYYLDTVKRLPCDALILNYKTLGA